jgi:hypothetical protein
MLLMLSKGGVCRIAEPRPGFHTIRPNALRFFGGKNPFSWVFTLWGFSLFTDNTRGVGQIGHILSIWRFITV